MRSLLGSLSYALTGVAHLIRTQRNARLHLVATLLATTSACWLRVSRTEAAILALAICSVWSAEAANTAIEHLADRVTRERDPLIGHAKDLAAAAVLLAATGALVAGLCILGPPFLAKIYPR